MGILKIQSSLKIMCSNKLSLDLFEKIGIIGSGGFSTVWKAKCNKISHLFAIKQISKTKVKKQDYLDLILNEKKIMKDLYFPFISNLYCTFQDETNLYFVIDYFSGGDLRYYLMKGKQFSENQIKFILACLIIALEYIYSKKIIHRDIKPENLLFDDRGYVYLCDFGISIYENKSENVSKRIGSNGYIAPEGNYSYLSDFYSIGIVTYELIFNERYDYKKDNLDFKEKVREKGFSIDLYYFTLGLLESNPNVRLGHEKGIYDLKNHSFFKGFNYESLKKKEMISPFKPQYNPKGYVKLSKNKDNQSTSSNSSSSTLENLKYIYNFDYICYNKLNDENKKLKLIFSKSSSSNKYIFNTPLKQNYKKIRNNSCDDDTSIDFKNDCLSSSREKYLFSLRNKNIGKKNIIPKKILFKNASMNNNLHIKKDNILLLPSIIQRNKNVNNFNTRVIKNKYIENNLMNKSSNYFMKVKQKDKNKFY